MLHAQCGDARIVHLGSLDFACQEKRLELMPMALPFPEQHESRRFQPRIDLVNGGVDRRGRCIDTWMGHDGEKLMDARPRNRPRCPSFRERLDYSGGPYVPFAVLAVGVDQQICVNGDQPPRPS